MGAAVNDPQDILEIVKHESEEVVDVDDETAESEDDRNITKDEELPAHTRPVIVLKRLQEVNVSKKLNSNTNTSPQQPDVANLKHQLKNESSKKKVRQSTSSNIIHRISCPGNLKSGKMSVSSRKVRGRVEKKEHKCQECEKVFNSLSHLKYHTRVHTGEKPFKCSFCPKTFARFTNMPDHVRMHTGERPFSCVHCTKSFVRLNSLRIHEKTHTGEKPFKCSFCTKAFRQLSHLQCHIRIHTGEKPFECFHCTETFAQSASLKCHLLRVYHTGEKTSLK